MNILQRQKYVGFSLLAVAIIAGVSVVSHSTISVSSTSRSEQISDPSIFSAVKIPASRIEKAIKKLDAIADETMTKTNLPGLSIAVVHNGKTVYAKGFGVRQLGSNAPVNENTVFQLASLSKPIGATVIAGVVGDEKVSWTDPVVKYLPNFVLSDPYVTQNLTIADLYSHRSGLPEHAGDLLEDIGYNRAEVLHRLRHLPLSPFRVNHQYTNFGLTAAAEAVSKAAGMPWEELSKSRLYDQLSMISTSSTFADFIARQNKALGHVREQNGNWIRTPMQRNPDAQSPAGGVSSSVVDVANWMQMVLGGGKFKGKTVIESPPLQQALTPHTRGSKDYISSLPSRTGFYGLGFGIGTDATGRTRFTHSGAFFIGSGTTLALLPAENLGIVVLTNGEPIGAAEAIAANFLDEVELGTVTFDWLALYQQRFSNIKSNPSELANQSPPSNPQQAGPLENYVAIYENEYYGPAEIFLNQDGLVLRLIGPESVTSQSFPLHHWDGNSFAYYPSGENALGISSVKFSSTSGEHGLPSEMTIENLNEQGLGKFKRR